MLQHWKLIQTWTIPHLLSKRFCHQWPEPILFLNGSALAVFTINQIFLERESEEQTEECVATNTDNREEKNQHYKKKTLVIVCKK